MTHCGTQKLETERLILRPFSMYDVSAMYRNWASDDQVTKFLTWPAHESEEITRMILSDWLTHYQEENYYHWGIELKELGEVIGSLAVVAIRENIGEAEIGYCLGKEWWGNG
ncbi:MAG: GNAT family N-acetyltransferase, partial [Clostridia bacterium]|nr:GNAT family N-acetyltransferase [Clostridia bacterium]